MSNPTGTLALLESAVKQCDTVFETRLAILVGNGVLPPEWLPFLREPWDSLKESAKNILEIEVLSDSMIRRALEVVQRTTKKP
jgi:hypothetical protein